MNILGSSFSLIIKNDDFINDIYLLNVSLFLLTLLLILSTINYLSIMRTINYHLLYLIVVGTLNY